MFRVGIVKSQDVANVKVRAEDPSLTAQDDAHALKELA
jgi:hypothetical protein